MKRPVSVWIGWVMALAAPVAMAQSAPAINLYAAGSLREVLTAVSTQFQKQEGASVVTTFAASGLLRERIEKGEPAHVFASANMAHPETLAKAGSWEPVRVFTRNVMCAITQPRFALTPETLLDAMLDPAVKVGTSTPKADPSGDYAWDIFRKADGVKPGSYAVLNAKALQLTGGPTSPKPPPGRGTYEWVMAEGQADVFLTYCTNAVAAQKARPELKVVEVPPALQVGATYGMTVRQDAPAAARRLADYILSPAGQALLRQFGFGAI
jgi:ABC-type molybdate transport system substrate-binding protein